MIEKGSPFEFKALVFDWNRTLFDPETGKESPGAYEVLKECVSRGLRLALASSAGKAADTTVETRVAQIEASPLRRFFEIVKITNGDKDVMMDEIVIHFNTERKKILIVDDRMVRGIRYGNQKGIPTAWLQKGKFSTEAPTEETGIPTFILASLKDLLHYV